MFKKALIAVLAAVVITAGAVGTYNLISARAAGASSQTTALAAADTAQSVAPQAGQAGSTAGGPRWQNNSSQAGSTASGQQAGGGQGRGRQGGGNNGNSTNGNGNRGNSTANQAQNNPSGTPDPQNGLQEWLTLSGQVSNFSANVFTLVTSDGQQIPVQLGSQNYVSGLGLTLQDGDAVTVVGFWETADTFTAGTLTLDASGEVISLRDDLGRPLWAGGGRNR